MSTNNRSNLSSSRGSKYDPDVVYLPRKLIAFIASASALESLTLAAPLNRNFATLADAVRSLHKLKVGTQAFALSAACVHGKDVLVKW